MFDSAPRGRAGLLVGSALGALLPAASAVADISADRIWEIWQSSAAQLGQSLSVDGVARAGNVLTVSGVTLSQVIDRDFAYSLTMGDIVFTERADGTVAIAMAPDFRLTMGPAEDGLDEGRLVLLIRNEGLGIIASGGDGAITYDYRAASIVAGVEEFVVEDEAMDLVMDLAVRGLEGRYWISTGADLSVVSETRAAGFALAISAEQPDGDGAFEMSLDIADLVSTSAGTRLDLAMQLEPARIGEAVAQGFGVSGSLGYGASEFSFDFSEFGERTYVAGTAEGGSASLVLTGERVGYSVASRGTTYVMRGPDMPLPEIGLSFGDLEIAFSLPAGASAVPQPMSALVRLVDLEVDDGLWSMIDMAGVLPRSPATLIVDLVGQASLTYGLFDPRFAMAPSFPGELHALQLRDLRGAIAGAELTGSGAFIFDNADTTTFEGLPRPMGAVDLTLTGGTTLIDNLVQLGLLPQDQALGARMALGFFTRPGDGPDTLVTTIEITPEGAIVANGQPIQ